MENSKFITVWGSVCLLLAITSIVDLLFYIPTTGSIAFFIGKKVLFTIAGAYGFWQFIVKPWQNKNKTV